MRSRTKSLARLTVLGGVYGAGLGFLASGELCGVPWMEALGVWLIGALAAGFVVGLVMAYRRPEEVA